MHFHHLPHKSQAPSFASQRTFADACIIRILVKPIFFKNGHHSRILHPAILNDSRINQFAGIVHIDIFRYIYFFEHFGHRKHGTRIEEARKMIVCEMIIKRIFGYLPDIGLKLLQIFDTENFLFGSRINNDKIAEPQIILYRLAKILWKGFRILIDKRSFHLVGILSVGGFGGSINQGDIFILRANPFTQFFPGQLVFCSFAIETHIADNTQHIIAILRIQFNRFFVVSSEQNFRPTPHPEHSQMIIECFFRKFFRFVQHKFVQHRQHRRIKPHRIFHYHDSLHAYRFHVVFHIHPVFYQFDDS
ncbi:MAG: hypothetical protein BWZ06_00938 [Bacteroidetes bacterium ADurb.BinA261]|nr:MAG: hypothetical protein BWZ06_00938 [Bacteroidetes bacterium ADurb.BinA261]